MPDKTEIFASGIPVEIGRIDRELKKLWDEGGGAMTRASLVNLAVYSEAESSLARNTEIVSAITEDHSCRAIVIAAAPAAPENKVQAWISAHCHISRAGSKQICSEQLSFLLEGPSANLLPNIVFSHLDSDLPFYLWWQGEFHDPMDPQLWAWVDRLIFDSRDWVEPAGQMRLLQTALDESKQRLVIRDLNWSRSLHHRMGLAQFFDYPDALPALSQIERVELDFAPTFRGMALLVAGWLAGQLGWTLNKNNGASRERLSFRANASGQTIDVQLNETPGQPLGRCMLDSAGSKFCVVHATGSDLLETSGRSVTGELAHQFLPAGEDHPVALVGEELMRGSRHHVYLRALRSIESLL